MDLNALSAAFTAGNELRGERVRPPERRKMKKHARTDHVTAREEHEREHFVRKYGLLPRLAKTERTDDREMRKEAHSYLGEMKKTGT